MPLESLTARGRKPDRPNPRREGYGPAAAASGEGAQRALHSAKALGPRLPRLLPQQVLAQESARQGQPLGHRLLRAEQVEGETEIDSGIYALSADRTDLTGNKGCK